MLGTVKVGLFLNKTQLRSLYGIKATLKFWFSSILIAMLSGIRENNAVKTLTTNPITGMS